MNRRVPCCPRCGRPPLRIHHELWCLAHGTVELSPPTRFSVPRSDALDVIRPLSTLDRRVLEGQAVPVGLRHEMHADATAARHARMRALRADGLSIAEIADEVGVSRRTVFRALAGMR